MFIDWAKSIVKVIGVVLLACSTASWAATLSVDTLTDDDPALGCTLREAMQSIMDQALLGGCSMPSGETFGVDDEIVFVNVPQVPFLNLKSQLPAVTQPLLISGFTGGVNPQIIMLLNADAKDPYRAFRVEDSAHLILSELVISGGYITEKESGGAISTDGTVTIVNSRITQNHGVNGGAIFIECGGSVEIYNSILAENTSSGDGGAIYGDNCARLRISNSVLNDNVAGLENGSVIAGSDGGAVFHRGHFSYDFVASGTTFSGNHASGSGGALAAWGTTFIYSSTLSGNSANYQGGALYVRPLLSGAFVDTDLVNTTIVDNESGFNQSSSVHLYLQSDNVKSNITLKNSVLGMSGGVGISDDERLISINVAPGAELVVNDNGGVWVQDESLLDYGVDSGIGVGLNNSPGLGALADNGGDNLTHLPLFDIDGEDSMSPLINSGACVQVSDFGRLSPEVMELIINTAIDQRGMVRRIGSGCDVGSVEVLVDVIFENGFELQSVL